MDKIILSLLLAVPFCIYVVQASRASRPSWEFLRHRQPDLRWWEATYPPQDLPVVERALDDIVSAFLLRKDDAHRLRPEDSLMDIYSAAYPSQWTADTLEFETFAQILEDEGISSEQCADITVLKVGAVIDMYIACQRLRMS